MNTRALPLPRLCPQAAVALPAIEPLCQSQVPDVERSSPPRCSTLRRTAVRSKCSQSPELRRGYVHIDFPPHRMNETVQHNVIAKSALIRPLAISSTNIARGNVTPCLPDHTADELPVRKVTFALTINPKFLVCRGRTSPLASTARGSPRRSMVVSRPAVPRDSRTARLLRQEDSVSAAFDS